VVVAVLALGFYFFSGNNQTVKTGPNDEGRLVLAITDAAANMGSVQKVDVTIDKVEVHSTTEGWVTLSSASKSYDLLELKRNGELQLMTDSKVKAGTYDQVRLDISKVVVTDSNGTHEAKLPSNELKINNEIIVNANSTATASFDFIADDSLHITGNGAYILAPVVIIETKSNSTVNIDSNNEVTISGGNLKSTIKIGMNEKGEVGINMGISKGVSLSLNSDGSIKTGTIVVIGSSNNNQSSNVGVGVNTEVSGNAGY